jgi:uncharacterized membrane protein YphA (DoxX/SURF4 family)
MPPILSLHGIGGCLELVGGLLLLVGFQTRAVAFIISGEMAVAYWMYHAPKSVFPAVMQATQRSCSASYSFSLVFQDRAHGVGTSVGRPRALRTTPPFQYEV